MQPVDSIPPFTEEGVQRLVGLKAAIPTESNPKKRWWITVRRVCFINPQSCAEWIDCEHGRFGKGGRWVDLKQLQWHNQKEDPLYLAIRKARATLPSA